MSSSGEHRLGFPLSESDPPPPLGGEKGDDPYIGAIFAQRYRLLSKIGQGSQARIYLARHLIIRRQVAVKVLLPAFAGDKTVVDRFLNEGRAAGTLGHPNIVESLDMGRAPDGSPFLVLELLEGKTLADEMALIGPFLVGRAAYIAVQVASAIAAANARKIIHRDLKPENVFLIDRGAKPDHVKVLDFGISKFVGTRVTTLKGQFLGTPDYMAPEQIKTPETVDVRADVYAVGGMMYAMLAGEAPFANIEFPRVLQSIVEDAPRRIADLRPQLPQELVAVIERAMAKDPAARYQTMAELEDALHPFALEPRKPGLRSNTGPTQAQPEGQPRAMAQSSPQLDADRMPESPHAVAAPRVTPPESAAIPHLERRTAGVGRVLFGIAAVLLLGGIGGGVFVMRRHAPTTSAGLAPNSAATSAATTAATVPVPADPPVALATAEPSDTAAASTAPAAAAPTGLRPAPAWPRPGRATPRPPTSAGAPSLPEPPMIDPPPVPTPAPTAPTPTPVVAPPVPSPVPVPTPAPAATGPAPGTLEPRAVNATIRGHATEVRGCYERARMFNADLKGKVTVRATVAPDGRVGSAGIASTTANDSRLETCVAGAFRSWQFPAPAGGVAGSVTYTFSFE